MSEISQKEIYDYLIDKGLSRNHALGMLANINAESSFDSSREGDPMIDDPTGEL